MKLTPVIAALRARCPYFENRVAGAAQFKNLPEVGKLKLPAAYVVPGDDSPGENKSQTDYWQELKEGFSVVVILSNGRDERGQFASMMWWTMSGRCSLRPCWAATGSVR